MAPIQVQSFPLTISRVTPLATQYLLVDCALPSAFTFQAGQYVEVTFVDGGGAFSRSYSIASAPSDTSVTFCVRLAGDGRAVDAWQRLKAGDILQSTPPKGAFTVQEWERPIVFVAGGAGIAPLRAMIREAMAAGLGSQLSLLYGCADAQAVPYGDELLDLSRLRPEWLRLHIVVERGQHPIFKSGNVLSILKDKIDPRAHFYICGPGGMASAVECELLGSGISKDAIFQESFG